MDTKELKKIATEKGVEFKKSWSGEKVLAALNDAGFNVESGGTDGPGEHQNDEPPISDATENAPSKPPVKTEPTQAEKDAIEIESLKNRFRVLDGEFDATDRMEDAYQVKMTKTRISAEVTVIRTSLENIGATEAVISVLKWQRANNMLDIADAYKLNAVEEKACTLYCECVVAPSGGDRFFLGETYKYSKRFDEGREKNVYTIFVGRVIAGEDQMDKDLVKKLDIGFTAKELAGEMPDERRLVRKNELVQSEFKRYFRHKG